MNISYVNGISVLNDAISNSIRDEINWLMSVPGNDIRLFAYKCDFKELPHSPISNPRDLIFDPFFQKSDLVIFHYGVFYPLFNALLASPKRAKKVVVFHNITPKEHLPASAHELINKSVSQMSNILFADHVICDSETNLLALKQAGISVPSSILPLALNCETQAPTFKPSFEDGVTRILFVGRFVKSKGVIDLLSAVETVLIETPEARIKVDLIGNLNFSDIEILEEVKATVIRMQDRFKQQLIIGLHGNAPDSLKKQLLSNADIFTLPTRHEGFCVPILEALNAACCVVAYNNSNVPYISGGFAQLVSTGDISSLAHSIKTTVTKTQSRSWINSGYDSYRSQVSRYCADFEPVKARDRFLRLISNIF